MVRTRFAPSPTGQLHLGNLRVAVFNHLFTRHHDGAFVIRVEDTDEARNVEGALEGILDDLAWAGLDWDEGPGKDGAFGPYLQSDRSGLHRARAIELLDAGKAYLCFCADESGGDPWGRSGAGPEGTPEGGPPPRGCPGGCDAVDPALARSRMDEGEAAAIRFPVPQRTIQVKDEIRGEIAFHGKDMADFVILRADGRATYNFAVVVDDVDMNISHVIRGSGHLSNTPKQALLFDALGAPRPAFAHLPMVLGADRRKLSKRAGAEGVRRLRDEGYLPDAVVNYLSLLGWSPGDDREVLSRKELVEEMSLARVGVSDAVFDEEKLRWMSGQHLALLDLDDVVRRVKPFVDRDRFQVTGEHLRRCVAAIRTRLQVLSDVNDGLALLYPGQVALRAGVAEALAEGPGAVAAVEAVRRALAGAREWEAESLGQVVREAGKGVGVRGPALFHPVRLALCAARSGPDLGLVLVALGAEETLARLAAIDPSVGQV
jgi:glutamyl-tRNA synthetase